MLLGPLLQRGNGIGMVGIVRVLWGQVILVLASRSSLNPLIFPLREGGHLAFTCHQCHGG